MPARDILMSAAGVGGGEAANYIEDVFSTYLYTGTGANRTIANGIDLATKGGLVWTKFRSGSFGTESHSLNDSVRGTTYYLSSNNTGAQVNLTNSVTGFISTGYTLGDDSTGGKVNYSAQNYASWTFAEQEKFFDVVTYTGTGTTMTVSHNLGSVPGMMIVKGTNAASAWDVYHRSLGNTQILRLSTPDAASSQPQWNNTSPTATEFTVKGGETANVSGRTYVAYLFAHDAGGFGTSGTDNVISCGSYTGNGSSTGPSITLGYEPQYVLVKISSGDIGSWLVFDVMRGMSVSGQVNLFPNTSAAESTSRTYLKPTATGFQITSTDFDVNGSGYTYIYMAIRRPMKVPTTGTEVFSPVASSAATGTKLTTGFPVDMQIVALRSSVYKKDVNTRLIGVNTTAISSGFPSLFTTSTAAESDDNATQFFDNTGFQMSAGFGGSSTVFWNFRRATGFHDVVCYTGTGSATTQAHNLGVAPELMIIKGRDGSTRRWAVYSSALGTSNTSYLTLEGTGASGSYGSLNVWNNTAPTSSVFTVGTFSWVNASTSLYVAYLFATCPGVSKVGSYTGTGATQTINCGFTGGARFVLIKRTDSTGDWYVWDTARGMVSGTDPKLALNSTAAETNANWVYTATTGFQIVTTDASVNASGGSYIFLAIS